MNTVDLNKVVTDAVTSAITKQFENMENTQLLQPPMVLTIEETCKVLCLSKPIVYQLVKRPGFPCFTVGKKILVDRKGLQKWVTGNCGHTIQH